MPSAEQEVARLVAIHMEEIAAERARIRKELLEGVAVLVVGLAGSSLEIEVIRVDALRAALDRICPEERAGERSGTGKRGE